MSEYRQHAHTLGKVRGRHHAPYCRFKEPTIKNCVVVREEVKGEKKKKKITLITM